MVGHLLMSDADRHIAAFRSKLGGLPLARDEVSKVFFWHGAAPVPSGSYPLSLGPQLALSVPRMAPYIARRNRA